MTELYAAGTNLSCAVEQSEIFLIPVSLMGLKQKILYIKMNRKTNIGIIKRKKIIVDKQESIDNKRIGEAIYFLTKIP